MERLAENLRAEVRALGDSLGVPGYVAGVYHDGDQTSLAHGLANVATSMPMTEDTGFLLGSITKVLTTTLVLRYVERGQVDLDERVTTYLPEFSLASPARADEIRVRNLISHTDGIDADCFVPDVNGPDALRVYLEQLGQCGSLFEPDEYVSYSNPAFLVAGRLLEALTGEYFDDLLQRELFSTVGMVDACTSAKEAILRRTAVGHFRDQTTQEARRTDVFMLPDSWSAAGSTPIVTVGDLLAFGRVHLDDGVAPSGNRVLSTELTQRMRMARHDMGTPNLPAIGLGWWLIPFGETVALWHGGGSPGGTSHLIIVPEHNLVFAAFGNGPGTKDVHDRLTLWLFREYLGLNVPDVAATDVKAPDLSPYEGSYRSHQVRIDLKAIDGQLEEVASSEPIDADQKRILNGFAGGQFAPPPRRLVAVGDDLFAPAEAPRDSLTGPIGRLSLVSFHGRTTGVPTFRSSALRLQHRQPTGA